MIQPRHECRVLAKIVARVEAATPEEARAAVERWARNGFRGCDVPLLWEIHGLQFGPATPTPAGKKQPPMDADGRR